jgi:hypothetical protein
VQGPSATTAVILATSEIGLVRALCERTLWLDEGRVVAIGPTEEILSSYEGREAGPRRGEAPPSPGASIAGAKNAPFNRHAALVGVELVAADDTPAAVLSRGEPATILARFEIRTAAVDVVLGCALASGGRPRLRAVQPEAFPIKEPGMYRARVTFPTDALMEGEYVGRIGMFTFVDGVKRSLGMDRAFTLDLTADGEDAEEPDEVSTLDETHEIIEIDDADWEIEREA